jgi:hypothetical protein
MYISRHHKAGQAIARAIADGRHGAHLVMTDVGTYKHDATDGPAGSDGRPDSAGDEAPGVDLKTLPHRIPISALPRNMSRAAKKAAAKHSVPDAFLVCPPPNKGEGVTYIIVEIKYCRDTDPAQQLQRAREQHTKLAASLSKCMRNADRVTRVPILLGVSGAIFKQQTVNTLKRIGVDGSLLTKLKYRLHRIAVKHLHWIHTTKRSKEKALEARKVKYAHRHSSSNHKRTAHAAGWNHADATCPSKRRKR